MQTYKKLGIEWTWQMQRRWQHRQFPPTPSELHARTATLPSRKRGSAAIAYQQPPIPGSSVPSSYIIDTLRKVYINAIFPPTPRNPQTRNSSLSLRQDRNVFIAIYPQWLPASASTIPLPPTRPIPAPSRRRRLSPHTLRPRTRPARPAGPRRELKVRNSFSFSFSFLSSTLFPLNGKRGEKKKKQASLTDTQAALTPAPPAPSAPPTAGSLASSAARAGTRRTRSARCR